uniref:Uncharacterized protein n=1 Tax=viral metagenome TaxID=1070528 RepID=A0A6C0C558_9ZZZZ
MVKNLSKRVKRSKSKSRKMRGGQGCGITERRKSRKMRGGSSVYKRKNKSKSRKSRKMSGGGSSLEYYGATILHAK